uniref:ATP-binding cassette sub-family A member 3-like n=1 Tax=Phascolarctos cinereus TaxID=38626 RepID=A0A6P5LY12_PHACI|nr:ATP-binding cassette sub-family A member 3-like [Phascolarctos cinereus]
MAMCRLFKLLLWKNYILKKRMLLSSLVEVLLPLLCAGVLISLRVKSKPQHKNSIRYKPLSIDDLPSVFIKTFPPNFLFLFYFPSESDAVKTIAKKVSHSFRFALRVKAYAEENVENGFSYTFSTIAFTQITNKSACLPLKVDYHLRFPFRQKFFNVDEKDQIGEVLDGWNTHLLFPLFILSGPRNPSVPDRGLPEYFREGFLSLQHAVNREIMYYHMNHSMTQQYEKISITMKRFPFPSYIQDPFISILEDNFSMLIMLSFLCSSIFIIHAVVQEKEKKFKEYMRIMGLSNWLHWSAWFFMYISFFIIVISLMILLFSLKVDYNVSVLTKSDPTLVFFFLLCFAIATISFSFMISVFFSKGIGIQWKHVLKISKSEKFGFGEVLIMLLIDSILYGLVTWYVETVFPGKYGIPQPWYFFVMVTLYWSGRPRNVAHNEELENKFNMLERKAYIQDEPKDLFAGVRICNLSKIFKSRNTIKKAVNNLTLNMYEGQITVLLGHNGAGKTTTLSILTGLLPPTSGEAYLSGYEISRDIVQIRKSLGLCPQYDILFDYMTVAEHLYFYVQLKGVSDKDWSDEINYILNILNLENKRNTISKSLSGGMKRKVSIGIALIGGSKVVMLDEPTSGMDPVSRRATWDLLQNQKSNRTILLTTHFMDEADLLGDRIAIMAKGELQCCGSSLFLKQKYGAGYHMIMVKGQHCNVHEIEILIREHIPNATMERNMGAELSFILPKENVHSFEALFEELEERQEELGISSFGASVTTMEEVFLRVSKQVDSSMDLQSIHLPSIRGLSNVRSKKKMDLTVLSKKSSVVNETNNFKFKLQWQKFYAMFIKKVLFTWRNWKMMVAQSIAPLLSIIFIIEVFKMDVESTTIPMLRLTLNQYGHTTVPFFISKTAKLHPNLSDHISNTIQAEGHMPLEVIGSKFSSFLPIEDFLISKAEEESDTFDENFLMAMSFQDKEDQTVISTLFNNQAYHTAPMALSMVENILYKLFFGSRASITVTNEPELPQLVEASHIRLFQVSKGHFLSISMVFGMSFMVSSFAILAISDRVLRSKHIQFISGISPVHYWLSFLLWDLITIFLNSLLLLCLMKVIDEKVYIQSKHPEAVVLRLLLYGWSVIPCMYLMSCFFSGPASGCAKLVVLNIITGIVPFIIFTITGRYGFQKLSDKLDILFQLLPNYDLSMAFSNLYYNYEIKRFCKVLEIPKDNCKTRFLEKIWVVLCRCRSGEEFDNIKPTPECGSRAGCEGVLVEHPWDPYTFCKNQAPLVWFLNLRRISWQSLGIGKYLTSMAISGPIFLLLLFFTETNFFRKLKISFCKVFEREKLSRVHSLPSLIFKDDDVEEEREKILNSLPVLLQNTPLITEELTKVCGHRKTPILTVNRISFTVQKNECFGLLGFNGAGKTSTFKMLTGENIITSGDAFINGKSVLSNLKTLQGQVSYCPQFDALLDHMTGRETLTMYARIWGIPEPQIQLYVKNMIQKLHLDPHADKLVKNYSGGNRRKLSTGIALMGNPSVVFLDEPSTGMDPVARRLLWNAVTEIRQLGKAIIITSHSLEECKALCTRLAIMVNGQFKCLGSPQHLKSKYGSGYTLLAKIKGYTKEEEKMAVEAFKTFVDETFPGSILEEEHQGMVHYHLPKENLKWSKVFGILEEVKDRYKLDDYSVSQVSLEQVFLSFAHLQNSKGDES